MPCDTRLREGQSLTQRIDQVKAALSRLERALQAGRVTVRIGATGAVAFAGWGQTDRDDVTDVCAFRTLTAQSSSALRMAVAKAEAMAGRKINLQAVAAGVHSHDGGKTFGPGH